MAAPGRREASGPLSIGSPAALAHPGVVAAVGYKGRGVSVLAAQDASEPEPLERT